MKLLLQGAGASAAVGLARSQARCLQRACAPAAPRPACSPCQAQGQALHTAQAAATESQQAAAPRPEGAGPGPRPSDGWRIAMLFDGDCPLCMREVNMLRRRDAQQGRIKFVDIASPDYSPSENAGISYEQAMGNIHAISREGQVFTNVEVFKRLYEQVGLGWVYSFANVGPLRAVADRVYDVWARYRLPLTRRPDMATIRAEKKTCKPG